MTPTLLFELRPSYGHDRFYPVNAAAVALLAVVGRKCLGLADLERLEVGGFIVELVNDPKHRSIA